MTLWNPFFNSLNFTFSIVFVIMSDDVNQCIYIPSTLTFEYEY